MRKSPMPSSELYIAATEEYAIKVNESVRWRNKQARAAEKEKAQAAKIRMPTFSFKGDDDDSR